VLDVEAWTGDLHRFKYQAWREEDTDVAAIVVTRGGEATAWINLVHVHALEERLVWHWARRAAHCRPPIDILYAHELPSRTWGDQEVAEA
jgi:hypothetical protein